MNDEDVMYVVVALYDLLQRLPFPVHKEYYYK